MARPKKTSLDYFSVDIDMVHDLRIRKLMNRKGGTHPLGVFMALLCLIYKNGYYINCDEDMVFLVASDYFEDEGYVREVILYCTELGLFEKELYDMYHVLTSKEIQEQYIKSLKQVRRAPFVHEYCLIDNERNDVSSEETGVPTEETRKNSGKTGVSSDKMRINSEKTEVSSEETHINPDETGISSEETIVNSEETHINSEETQDLEKKKKKRKEPKENKNKKSPSSSSTSPAREESVVLEEKTFQEDGLNAEIDLLLKDSLWSESVTSRFKLPPEHLEKYLETFRSECLARGKLRHTGVMDIKSHFSDWLRIQIEKQNNYASDYGKSRYISQGTSAHATDLRRPAPITPGARQADFSGTF